MFSKWLIKGALPTVALSLSLATAAYADYYPNSRYSNSRYSRSAQNASNTYNHQQNSHQFGNKAQNRMMNRNAMRNANKYGMATDNMSDQQLEKKIREEIAPDWQAGFEALDIEVNNGQVTLRGLVETWDARQEAENKIRNIEGVKRLKNLLQVQQEAKENRYSALPMNRIRSRANRYGNFTAEGPMTKNAQNQRFSRNQNALGQAENPQDSQLSEKVRDAVTKGWFWNSYKHVSINTRNGIVTLEGTVDSKKNEQDLIQKVENIPGVKKVVSNLTIKEER